MSVSGNGVIMLKLVCLEMVHTLNKTQFVWENGLIGGFEHEFYDFAFSWECHHPS
jgi:hypothetical protein